MCVHVCVCVCVRASACSDHTCVGCRYVRDVFVWCVGAEAPSGRTRIVFADGALAGNEQCEPLVNEMLRALVMDAGFQSWRAKHALAA